MIIAVDFDGTIVEHAYPKIGKEIPFAIDTLIRIRRECHCQIILWSVREGLLLQEAVDFCHKRGLDFYAANKNFPEEEYEGTHGFSRKIKVDIFIDDRNLGGLPEWSIIYEMIASGKYLNGNVGLLADQLQNKRDRFGHKVRHNWLVRLGLLFEKKD
jgi:hypothetical protein